MYVYVHVCACKCIYIYTYMCVYVFAIIHIWAFCSGLWERCSLTYQKCIWLDPSQFNKISYNIKKILLTGQSVKDPLLLYDDDN